MKNSFTVLNLFFVRNR